MLARDRCGRLRFEHVFDQVDAAARAVEFVAGQQVRGAGRVAETAMHTRAQNFVGAATGRRRENGGW